MNVNSKHLATALSECSRATDKLPILASVRLEAIGDELRILSTNLDVWIERRVKCDGDLAACCVDASKLSRLLDTSRSETASLKLNGQRLTFTAGAVSQLSVLPASDFPPAPEFGNELAVPAADLADGIEAVEWVPNSEASKDEANVSKMNILVEMSAKSLDCVGFTGVVMARFSRGLICESRSLLIPCKFASLLVPVLREPNSTAYATTRTLTARSDAGSVCVKLSEGQYGNWRQHIQGVKCLQTVEFSTELILLAALRAQVFWTASDYPKMVLELTGTHLKMSAANGGDDTETEVTCVSEPGWISLNARYLANALKHLGGDSVKCSIAENGTVWSVGDTSVLVAQLGFRPPAVK